MHRPALLVLAVLILSGASMPATADREPAPAGSIVMLDSRTGEELWRLRGSNNRFHKGASVGSGIVLTVLDKCHGDSDAPRRSQTVALDARTGETRWHSGERTYAIGPAHGGVAVLNSRTATTGRDVESGDRLWKSEIGANAAAGDLVLGLPPGTPNPNAGFTLPRMSAYDRYSGKLRWTLGAPDKSGSYRLISWDQQTVIVVGANGSDPRHETFFVVDRVSGEVLSEMTPPPAYRLGGIVAVDGLLVGMRFDQADDFGGLGFVTNEVIALDLETGSVTWTKQLPSPAVMPAFLQRTQARQVVLLDNAGALRTAMAFDTHTGKTLWSRTEAQILAADSRVTLLDKNSYAEGRSMLEAVNTRSGELIWERPIPIGRIGKLFASIDGRYIALSGGCS